MKKKCQTRKTFWHLQYNKSLYLTQKAIKYVGTREKSPIHNI